jgi:hypothetical protein
MKTSSILLCIVALLVSIQAMAVNLPDGVTTEDWQHINQHIIASRYHPRSTAEGYVAENATQGWQVHFAADGKTTLKHTAFEIGMRLQTVGTRHVTHDPVITAAGDTLTYQYDAGIAEWWVNSPDRTEQWFRINNRPSAAGSLRLTIGLDTTAEVSQSGNQLMFTTADNTRISYDRLKVWDSQGQELPSHMELVAEQSVLALVVDDRQASYPITIDPSFSQENYLKPTVVDQYDRFGTSLAIDDDTLVIGMPADASAATVINGDSSDNSAPNAGSVYVYVRSGNAWVQQAYLKASNAEEGDLFGISVAVSGNTVVVGASDEAGDVNSTMTAPNNNESDAGAVYVFTRAGTTWSQQAYLKAFNAEHLNKFGKSVAIDGNTIAVGTPGDDGDANSSMINPNTSANYSGAVHVFDRTGTTWTQTAYLKASNAEPFDSLGDSVSMDGDTVVAGAIGESGDASSSINTPNNAAILAGAAYVFLRDGSTWSQEGYLKAHNAGIDDQFGSAVDIDDDTIVVGSGLEDGDINSTMVASNNNAVDAGAAYVFVRDSGTWTQQAYLKAGNADEEDMFGGWGMKYAVAVSGDHVVVGARTEDGDANSTMASPNDNGISPGAAYVFSRVDDEWLQRDYLKSDNIANYDYFGTAVAMDQDHIVVTATGEDGDANSTAALPNNNTTEAGAVYVFKGMYYIGGQVFGLPIGGPLELTRDGSELITVTHNGSYEFPTAIQSNNIYNVGISDVPAGYVCSIINGSGHLAYADVNNVDVFCSVNGYHVTGTVSGLTGSGLVLRNNGTYDVIINSNGPFDFGPDFANGTPYDVEVLTQPDNGQICAVSNGSGTISGTDAQVSVDCVALEFTVGGTVSGLDGTVVLQNNGMDDLTLTADGDFTFATPITDGDDYQVSVLTQPAHQSCAVSQASGTVAGVDVTDVQVNCADNSYFIGGTVSGLAASGLVLQNNGADDLSITVNGGFVFPQPLLHGSPYQVTVAGLPNEQNCQVNQGSGVIDGDDVVDVDVQCVTNTYLIGVSVTGLTGPGLLMQNNGTDDLVITQNGVTPFATRWVSGSDYAVTVASQPDDPGNTCEIMGSGEGVVSGEHVLITVLCGNDLIYQQGFE